MKQGPVPVVPDILAWWVAEKLESLELGSVIFECKEGPYEPLGDEDILTK